MGQPCLGQRRVGDRCTGVEGGRCLARYRGFEQHPHRSRILTMDRPYLGRHRVGGRCIKA